MNDQPIFETSPLERVREGMAVLNESGVRLGTVERIRLGEPTAVTTAGQTPEGDGVSVAVAPINSPGGSTAYGGAVPFPVDAGEEPDVPDPLRTRLRRVGFIEVKDSDLHGADRYVPGDRVAEVTDDTVRLGPAATPIMGGGLSQPTASAQASSQTATANAEPMLRTGLGTAQYVRNSQEKPWLWSAVGGGGALVGLSAATAAWLYRRRQQARPEARLRRSMKRLANNLPEDDRTRLGGLGGGLLLTLLLGAILSRARGAARIAGVAGGTPAAARQGQPGTLRQGPPGILVGLVVAALGVSIGLLRRRRSNGRATDYIGTPGVESAAGRDRTRTGELPPDYGLEHVRR